MGLRWRECSICGDVLELIHDRLDERALAQQELVGERHEEIVAHIIAQFGNKAQPMGEEELLGKRRGDGALITEELAKEPMNKTWNGPAIIGIARGKTKERVILRGR